MTLLIHTAHISYVGEDRLDITRRSAGADGIAFAPSWRILLPALRGRNAGLEEQMWPTYVTAYQREMEISYNMMRRAWQALLARPSVTLICYCQVHPEQMHCHRVLLAEMLEARGAQYQGERWKNGSISRGAAVNLLPSGPTKETTP